MIPKVVCPCRLDPGLDEAPRVCCVLEEPPLHRPIPATVLAKLGHHAMEAGRVRWIDTVFHLDHDRSPLKRRFPHNHRVGPMMRGRMVDHLVRGPSQSKGERGSQEESPGDTKIRGTQSAI